MQQPIERTFIRLLTRLMRKRVGAGHQIAEFDPFVWLKQAFRFRTLIDVGAADGAYGGFIARYLGVEHAYYFEPRPECREPLTILANGLPHGEVFPVALTNVSGVAELIQTDYAASSSLLPPHREAVREFPQNAARNRIGIQTARLDDLLAGKPTPDDMIIKVDVQGVEDKVIRGGGAVFARARVVLIEMCFVPFYENQPLFEEVHDLLVACGLRFNGIKNQIPMPQGLRPGFAHCIYLRP